VIDACDSSESSVQAVARDFLKEGGCVKKKGGKEGAKKDIEKGARRESNVD